MEQCVAVGVIACAARAMVFEKALKSRNWCKGIPGSLPIFGFNGQKVRVRYGVDLV